MISAGQWFGSIKSEKGIARFDCDHEQNRAYTFLTINPAEGEKIFLISEGIDTASDEFDAVCFRAIRPQTPLEMPHPTDGKPAKIRLRSEKEGLSLFVRASSGKETWEMELDRSDQQVSEEYQFQGIDVSWEDFKKIVPLLARYKYVYRGQAGVWPIRSSFHRKNRWNMYRYFTSTIRNVQPSIEAFTSREFPLDNLDSTIKFLGLLQHHRFPTPLIDWTFSPFIAAFFALQSVRVTEFDKVQIFILDGLRFNSMNPNLEPDVHLVSIGLKLIDAAIAGNQRHLPQQSISMLTNIDQVGAFLKYMNKNQGSTLITLNLSVSERQAILAELSSMGITAASLFPSLDGICEALRGKFFGDYSQLPNWDIEKVIAQGLLPPNSVEV